MSLRHPNPNRRDHSKPPKSGRTIVPDDPRMADHTFHPTKGFRAISAKRSRASMAIQAMATGKRPFVFGGGYLKRFLAEGY
jgi:hypothetical protein